jgi:uncharacterized delta-60 repeat protein
LVAGSADLVATQFDFALVRYNANGSLDSSFGNSGKVTTDFNGGLDGVSSMALQTDGKIVLAGFATAGDPHMALARYNANGTLDGTFGTGGKIITDINGTRNFANALAIQSDGKIIIGGSTLTTSGSFVMFALVRYNTDGSLDSTFGSSSVPVPVRFSEFLLDTQQTTAGHLLRILPMTFEECSNGFQEIKFRIAWAARNEAPGSPIFSATPFSSARIAALRSGSSRLSSSRASDSAVN